MSKLSPKDDLDNDGLTNLQESQFFSNPLNNNTDSDRFLDFREAEIGSDLRVKNPYILICIPGSSGNPQDFYINYDLNNQTLINGFHDNVYVYDHPNSALFGWDIINFAYDLDNFLTGKTSSENPILNIQGAIIDIVGHSLGGIITAQFIQTYYRNNLNPLFSINKILTLGSPLQGAWGYSTDFGYISGNGDLMQNMIGLLDDSICLTNKLYSYSYVCGSKNVFWTNAICSDYGAGYMYGNSAIEKNGINGGGSVPTSRCFVDFHNSNFGYNIYYTGVTHEEILETCGNKFGWFFEFPNKMN